MNRKLYLEQEISNILSKNLNETKNLNSLQDSSKSNKLNTLSDLKGTSPSLMYSKTHKKDTYFWQYNKTRLLRFIIQSLIVFIFQYLTIINIPLLQPLLPIYPPIGIAFCLFYLLGNNVFLGLLVAEIVGYSLHGMPWFYLIFYVIGDLIFAGIGAYLCFFCFSSDRMPFANNREFIYFLLINGFFTALFSTTFKIIPLLSTDVHFTFLYYYFLNSWLADFNAIVIFSSFVLSWVNVPFSREHISNRSVLLPITGLCLFIIITLLSIKQFEFIYVLLFVITLCLCFAYYYGYLISTLFLFIDSCIFLVYFIVHSKEYMFILGLEKYIFIPSGLFLFSILMIYLGHLSCGVFRASRPKPP